MMTEVLEALNPRAGGTYVDGTIGGGGHAEAILKASAPDGRLFGCDRDAWAVEAARARLTPFADRVEIRRGNFTELPSWIAPATCDGVLLDLGVSSAQLDRAERGFSFQQDGPLDMRMDTRQSLTAADVVNQYSPQELARVFSELGGERQALRVARAIERERRASPIQMTGQLAGLIERVIPRRGSRIHPATKVFQGLRLAVNDELGSLREGLKGIWALLRPGGRLAIITFHSLEDRLVKEFGRERTREYTFPGDVDVPELRVPVVAEGRWITRKAIHPSPDEVRQNARSRSAQLRVLERN